MSDFDRCVAAIESWQTFNPNTLSNVLGWSLGHTLGILDTVQKSEEWTRLRKHCVRVGPAFVCIQLESGAWHCSFQGNGCYVWDALPPPKSKGFDTWNHGFSSLRQRFTWEFADMVLADIPELHIARRNERS